MLLRPRVAPPHTPLISPTDQSKQILNQLNNYSPRRGLLIAFEELVDWLTPQSTSNQFEESLKNLGNILGYNASRPEDEDGVGPDVLWLLSASEALVLEAKSRKTGAKPITKEEHSQLLESMVWFSENYATHTVHSAIVNAVPLVTKNVTPGTALALTLSNLDLLIQRTRSLIQGITSTSVSEDTILARCEQLLSQLQLNPQGIRTYLEPLKKSP